MFTAIAPAYDLNNRVHSFGLDQRWRRKTVKLCRIKPTEHVLDVACGTGDLTEAFADAGPASVLGLDFTEAMLDIAREKTSRRKRSRPTAVPQYRHGDAMELPFEDDSYDVLAIAFGIRNVAEPLRALGEFRRVLRPGGRLAVLEFSEPRNPVLRLFSRLYTRQIMPVTASLLARDRTGAYRYLPKSVSTFQDRQAFVAMLNQVGFGRVQQYPLAFGTCIIYLAQVDDMPGNESSPSVE